MKVIDADNLIMGRLASHVAKLLISGEEVAIVNAEKTIISGRKKNILAEYHQKRTVGGPRKAAIISVIRVTTQIGPGL